MLTQLLSMISSSQFCTIIIIKRSKYLILAVNHMAELKEVDTFKESFKFFKKLSVDDLRARAVDLGSGDVDKHTNEVKCDTGMCICI